MFDYAPAPEAKLASFQKSYGHFIGGKFTKPANLYPTINPATEEVLAQISHGTAKDVDLAVKSARSSYEKVWSKLSGAERGKYLYRIARIMQERARELAVAETLNNGKPIKETRDFDVPTAVSWFFYYAGWADKLDHAGLGSNPQALGVAAQVVPWNFPLMMLAWKIAPALAAGNTIVLKPSETTPLSALLFAEICQQAEIPEGVVNIVTGFGDTGAALVGHKDVNKVAFTGSTEVGKIIAKQVAGSNKKVTLELGGKAANIVFDDAPIDQAIEGVINGIFFNQGHVCCAGSRLLIQESIHDEFIKKLVKKGVSEGGELWQPECKIPRNGFWFAPAIVDNVSPANTVAREEIFGPVLSVITFRTPAEAVTKANNTEYGLSAGIWTEKGSKMLKLADQLNAGVIWSNTFNQFDPTSPFGGFKESGYGREGGRQGLLSYLKAGK